MAEASKEKDLKQAIMVSIFALVIVVMGFFLSTNKTMAIVQTVLGLFLGWYSIRSNAQRSAEKVSKNISTSFYIAAVVILSLAIIPAVVDEISLIAFGGSFFLGYGVEGYKYMKTLPKTFYDELNRRDTIQTHKKNT